MASSAAVVAESQYKSTRKGLSRGASQSGPASMDGSEDECFILGPPDFASGALRCRAQQHLACVQALCLQDAM